MAENKSGRLTPEGTAKHQLGAHRQPERLAAHKEPEQLPAHDESEDTVVPAVTADVDETPGFVKYGAAVLLGLAFGVGCYVWIDGAPQRPFEKANGIAQTVSPSQNGDADIPNPFYAAESYEPEYLLVQVPNGTAASLAADSRALSANSDVRPVAAVSGPVVYLFNYDSSVIPETAALTDLAQRARKGGYSLDVKAYTDEHGRVAYNRRLSERRARAVADYLIAHGADPAKITAKGMGPTHAYANDAQDRRAEVVLIQ